MSRYRGPRLKIIRRLKTLPGLTSKRPKNRKDSMNRSSSRKISQYRIRLEEKQKLRFHYGLTERQLLKYVRIARRAKGSTGQVLLQLLEMRLDNILFRLGMAPTIPGARQLVNHGHVTVNGKKVDIPSYRVKPGDVISLKEDDKNLKVVLESLSKVTKRVEFITYDENKLEATYVRLPERNELNADINESLIVEFYNK